MYDVQGPAAKAEDEGRIVIAANNPISCLHEYAKKVGFRFLTKHQTACV